MYFANVTVVFPSLFDQADSGNRRAPPLVEHKLLMRDACRNRTACLLHDTDHACLLNRWTNTLHTETDVNGAHMKCRRTRPCIVVSVPPTRDLATLSFNIEVHCLCILAQRNTRGRLVLGECSRRCSSLMLQSNSPTPNHRVPLFGILQLAPFVAFLASDDAKIMTGAIYPLDAGASLKMS